MNVGFSTNNFANTVAPFNPTGKQVVGEENVKEKNSPLKSIEESAGSARSQNKPAQQDTSGANPVAIDAENPSDSAQPDQSDTNSKLESSARETAEQNRREILQQQEIQALAARDREVRAHEQAHAAVGGQHAGAPRYEFTRGPDGVSYAVGGEVSISTSKASTPEATISKAQQVRRAALAPAEPSPQDRRVAATATQMEIEARKEIVEIQQREAAFEREQRLQEKVERDTEGQGRREVSEGNSRERSVREDAFKEQASLQNSFQQRLIDIGVRPVSTEAGQIISQAV